MSAATGISTTCGCPNAIVDEVNYPSGNMLLGSCAPQLPGYVAQPVTVGAYASVYDDSSACQMFAPPIAPWAPTPAVTAAAPVVVVAAPTVATPAIVVTPTPVVATTVEPAPIQVVSMGSPAPIVAAVPTVVAAPAPVGAQVSAMPQYFGFGQQAVYPGNDQPYYIGGQVSFLDKAKHTVLSATEAVSDLFSPAVHTTPGGSVLPKDLAELQNRIKSLQHGLTGSSATMANTDTRRLRQRYGGQVGAATTVWYLQPWWLLLWFVTAIGAAIGITSWRTKKTLKNVVTDVFSDAKARIQSARQSVTGQAAASAHAAYRRGARRLY